MIKVSTIDRGSESFENECNSAMDAWVDAIDGKAGADHTHGEGGVVVTLIASEANLGTGATDGEMKICADSGNRYTWDDGNSKWRVMSGNIYAANPSSATYTIETGTVIYNTTDSLIYEWNGSAFIRLTAQKLLAKSSNYNVLAADLTGFTLFTNTGASGEVILTLPAGAANYSFGGLVTVAQYLQFLATNGENFRYGAEQGAANGYIRINVVGRYVWCNWSGTEWVITEMQGPWNYDE